jgi:hypothetical protein
METVKLKNGTEEVAALVKVTMVSVKGLWNSGLPGLLMVSDLVQICRCDPSYRKFGTNEEELTKLGLLQSGGQVHDSIRNIVLSAFTGDKLDLVLGSPIAE